MSKEDLSLAELLVIVVEDVTVPRKGVLLDKGRADGEIGCNVAGKVLDGRGSTQKTGRGDVAALSVLAGAWRADWARVKQRMGEVTAE